ncbi:hypothetical protein BpHYR1_019568 [Brachionus plicatilis]|uniref:Uncharacterized protein n=1 Tax=Brachionus plicatilis TaxID=10195 RepID=A0A3M7Q437_BRAPC|nr:hypothetical protein BpHYR1_019568 [Brachionus plicatilis]
MSMSGVVMPVIDDAMPPYFCSIELSTVLSWLDMAVLARMESGMGVSLSARGFLCLLFLASPTSGMFSHWS